MKRPAVLVVTRRTIRKNKFIDYVAEAHLALLVRLKTLPVMVPVVEGARACLPGYLADMRGLLLVEGEDIEPKHFKATRENYSHLEKTHPLKDEIEMELIRQALRMSLPILGICRGSQLLNVVCGGSLYGDVQKEKKSRLKHINFDRYDSYRHPISIVAGSPLEKWYATKALRVNSYHHQGIRDLAPRFQPMAYAKDGLVEGFYDPKENFVVGLQFHPERLLEEPAGNWHIWKAFGAAVRRAR
ncbi:MAG TPA: gamma-glutamyl-gamma-aminobutyrate hydrolase family protein [Candidatus Acidoferrum sp.]|jgi:gamma-glutamyl-gamma-aminobutyrate hydrolase PuuD|nr:gamma-glutamyl-gamma-aminobutyrate hydrolase family protein [Candidatus Acidoferrum sp.]